MNYKYFLYVAGMILLILTYFFKDAVTLLLGLMVIFITFFLDFTSKINEVKKDVNEVVLKFRIKDEEERKLIEEKETKQRKLKEIQVLKEELKLREMELENETK